MNLNRTFSHVFNFQTEIHDIYYYVTVNINILYPSYTFLQYLDVQQNKNMYYEKFGLFICSINDISC